MPHSVSSGKGHKLHHCGTFTPHLSFLPHQKQREKENMLPDVLLDKNLPWFLSNQDKSQKNHIHSLKNVWESDRDIYHHQPITNLHKLLIVLNPFPLKKSVTALCWSVTCYLHLFNICLLSYTP